MGGNRMREYTLFLKKNVIIRFLSHLSLVKYSVPMSFHCSTWPGATRCPFPSSQHTHPTHTHTYPSCTYRLRAGCPRPSRRGRLCCRQFCFYLRALLNPRLSSLPPACGAERIEPLPLSRATCEFIFLALLTAFLLNTNAVKARNILVSFAVRTLFVAADRFPLKESGDTEK